MERASSVAATAAGDCVGASGGASTTTTVRNTAPPAAAPAPSNSGASALWVAATRAAGSTAAAPVGRLRNDASSAVTAPPGGSSGRMMTAGGRVLLPEAGLHVPPGVTTTACSAAAVHSVRNSSAAAAEWHTSRVVRPSALASRSTPTTAPSLGAAAAMYGTEAAGRSAHEMRGGTPLSSDAVMTGDTAALQAAAPAYAAAAASAERASGGRCSAAVDSPRAQPLAAGGATDGSHCTTTSHGSADVAPLRRRGARAPAPLPPRRESPPQLGASRTSATSTVRRAVSGCAPCGARAVRR